AVRLTAIWLTAISGWGGRAAAAPVRNAGGNKLAKCDIPHAVCVAATLPRRPKEGGRGALPGFKITIHPLPRRARQMTHLFAVIVARIGLTGVGGAGQAPVAVVEDVQGKVSGAELMDYVVPGQVIKLSAGSSIVIGYMKSCWRETISGIGTVIVGTEESSVHL